MFSNDRNRNYEFIVKKKHLKSIKGEAKINTKRKK